MGIRGILLICLPAIIKNMKTIILSFLILIRLNDLYGQSTIHLNNGSFEGSHTLNQIPRGWTNCENPDEIKHDGQEIHSVFVEPKDGNSYLALVTRDNETWESICQELNTPLLKDETYIFNIYLAKSEDFICHSPKTNSDVNYNRGVRLRLWGGSKTCSKKELLCETVNVDHNEWKNYELKFSPQDNIEYIILEAFYKLPTLFPYNGHILLDGCSDIKSMKFIETIDTTLNVAEIEELILFCNFEYLSNESEKPIVKIALLRALYDIEEGINNKGIKRYIESESYDNLTWTIRIFEELKFNHSVPVIKKIIEVTSRNKETANLSKEDTRFLESCEALFKEKFEEDDFTKKISNYIEKNKVSILEEITRCR